METIQIIAEAYDVAMDISFPRGTYVKPLRYQLIVALMEQELMVV